MAAGNFKEHEATYGSFMATLKWAVPVIAVIAFFVVLLIA